MKVGFTGTRDGMTEDQTLAMRTMLRLSHDWSEFHHGCCVGADEHVALMVSGFFYPDLCRVVGHPSNLKGMTSQRVSLDRQPLPPLDRNRNIVDETDCLIAAPRGPEELRSGTWHTIRYARKRGKKVVIIWPNGEIEK